jgi:hypothetical protein
VKSLVKKLMTLLKLTIYCSGGVQDRAGGEMVREGGEELGQEVAEEQRVGGAGEDHQHGGSELKGKMSSSLSFLGSLNFVVKNGIPVRFLLL